MLRWLRPFAAFGAATSCALTLSVAAPPAPKSVAPLASASVPKPAAKKAAKKAAVPPAPEPHIALRLEPRPQNAWVVSIVNEGDAPLEIVADARLLRLEVEPPSDVEETAEPGAAKSKAKFKKLAKKPTEKTFTCTLPLAMRSDERTLVLAPGRRYLEAIDPRLFCLDASKKIIEGTKVTAKLGWAPAKQGAQKPPFIVRPPPSSTGSLAAMKELVAEPVVVTKKNAPRFGNGAPSSGKTKALVARAGKAQSALRATNAQVTLQVENVSEETVSVYARPQLVAATVRSPRGIVTACDGWARPAPIVDFVVRLKPNARWSATVLLASICPKGTFDLPGLYEIVPRLHADPVPWEPKAIVGDIVADTPQLLRIEEGEKPFHDLPPLSLDTSE